VCVCVCVCKGWCCEGGGGCCEGGGGMDKPTTLDLSNRWTKLSVSRFINFYVRLNVLCGSGYTTYGSRRSEKNRSVRNNIG